jgi:hypothetical protein
MIFLRHRRLAADAHVIEAVGPWQLFYNIPRQDGRQRLLRQHYVFVKHV